MTNILLTMYISLAAWNIGIATYFVVKKLINEIKQNKKKKEQNK